MKVRLLGKDLFGIPADICVSTVHHSKDLEIGHLSKLMLMKAGQEVQEKLKAAHDGEDLKEGQIVDVEPGKLKEKFRHIFFVCLFQWNEKNAGEIKEVVCHCCQMASGNNLTSLVFPCLGTGGLGFPEKVSSEAMMEGLALFAYECPESSLETVYISLHGKPPPCMMEWDDMFQTMVQQYNECFAGLSPPIDYVTVAGTGKPGGTAGLQNAASASVPKVKGRNGTTKAHSDTSVMAPGNVSSTSSGWLSLPSWLSTSFSTNLNVGGVQASATPAIRGRVESDAVEVDIGVRLRVACPWLKAVFGKFAGPSLQNTQ